MSLSSPNKAYSYEMTGQNSIYLTFSLITQKNCLFLEMMEKKRFVYVSETKVASSHKNIKYN